MDDINYLPFHHETTNFKFEITDLPPDHPAALHGWPGATLILTSNLKGDDTFVRTLIRIVSIASHTVQCTPDGTRYTFLVHPNLRTNTLYTPAHIAADITIFVNLLKERIQWRKTSRGKALVSSTGRGVFVTLRGFTNIEDARNALKRAAPQGADHLITVSTEDCTFKIISHYKDEVIAYFN